jgi:hypothetical protein
MSRQLDQIARKACHTGQWLFAACDANAEGRQVAWFDQRARDLRIAARKAAAPIPVPEVADSTFGAFVEAGGVL